jgi:hypothetical protein
VFGKLVDETEGLASLEADLRSGRWQQRNKDIVAKDNFDFGKDVWGYDAHPCFHDAQA